MLSNRLNEKKKIELTFKVNDEELTYYFNDVFPPFYQDDDNLGSYDASYGDILAFNDRFYIMLVDSSASGAEVIGNVNEFSSYDDLMALIGNSGTINLEFVLKTEKPDTNKIAEINIKIIIIIIIGLSLLIILFIIKFIG